MPLSASDISDMDSQAQTPPVCKAAVPEDVHGENGNNWLRLLPDPSQTTAATASTGPRLSVGTETGNKVSITCLVNSVSLNLSLLCKIGLVERGRQLEECQSIFQRCPNISRHAPSFEDGG